MKTHFVTIDNRFTTLIEIKKSLKSACFYIAARYDGGHAELYNYINAETGNLRIPVFSTLESAMRYIDGLNSSIYHFSHGESTRPQYRVLTKSGYKGDWQ
jgi:hypothetical protein